MGVEDGDDLGDGIRLLSPPSDLGEEELGDDRRPRGEVGRKVAGLTEGDPADPPCTGEIGGEERRGRELARGLGEEERLPKESSPSKSR